MDRLATKESFDRRAWILKEKLCNDYFFLCWRGGISCSAIIAISISEIFVIASLPSILESRAAKVRSFSENILRKEKSFSFWSYRSCL